jgi:hypothetical protein
MVFFCIQLIITPFLKKTYYHACTLQVPTMGQSTYAAPSMESSSCRSSLVIILTSQLLTTWIYSANNRTDVVQSSADEALKKVTVLFFDEEHQSIYREHKRGHSCVVNLKQVAHIILFTSACKHTQLSYVTPLEMISVYELVVFRLTIIYFGTALWNMLCLWSLQTVRMCFWSVCETKILTGFDKNTFRLWYM